MNPFEITVDDLRSIQFQPQAGITIDGLLYRRLETHVDGRGDVVELWSEPWTGDGRFAIPKHVYQSATDHGVIKAWHLHARHTDQFAVTRGKMQIVCVDLRPDSPTYAQVNSVIVGIERPSLLLIPPGVMHGWKALSMPETIVVNLQTEIYDPHDEFRFPWDCVLNDIWEPRNG